MSMLTPRFRAAIKDIPESPLLAIIRLSEEIEIWSDEPENTEDDDATRRQFSAFARRFIEKHDLDIPLPMVQEVRQDFNSVRVALRNFTEKYQDKLIQDEIDELIESAASTADAESFGYAQLNQAEKQRIHGNIQRIRDLIESSQLTERKKNSLFQRLNNLATDVDLSGTRTDRFFSFMGDAAFVLGDMANKAKPFTDEVKDMIKTIAKARSRKEGTALPPGEEVLRLPAPDEGDKYDAH